MLNLCKHIHRVNVQNIRFGSFCFKFDQSRLGRLCFICMFDTFVKKKLNSEQKILAQILASKVVHRQT